MSGTMQAKVAQAPLRTHLSLKGSVALVSDFFLYSIQSILYQRNIYPSDEFKMTKKFNTQVLTTIDEGLRDYLERAMNQIQEWLSRGEVRRIVVAIVEKETQETIERWQFDVDVTGKGTDEAVESKENLDPTKETSKKTDQQVKNEIGAIIKQITASCTFLPMLEEPCAFTILAYTDLQTSIPLEWSESDARLIAEGQAEQVKLRSFSTHVHSVDALVAYRRPEEED